MKYEKEFQEAIEDDLDTPRALALAWDLVKDETLSPAEKRATLLAMDRVFGLDLEHQSPGTISRETLSSEMQALVAEREAARAQKKWEKADALRQKIEEGGIAIEDTDDGPRLTKNTSRLP